ncbi:MAG: cation:proton antiporter [Bryobacteraceae bacterium]
MHADSIPLMLLVVFGSAKLLGEVFERLRMPGLVGEILAGVLVGPGILRWIAPNDVLNALAELGVMFLLFGVGLEIKRSDLLRVGRIATLVASLGVVVPFFLGWGILAWWGAPRVEGIFVGAAMVATSVGITAKVLSDRGLLSMRASQVILAAAVIDDVLGLLALAVVSGVARGPLNLPELALTAVLAIGFTVLVAHWGTIAAQHAVPRLAARLRSSEAPFHIALILLFALSLLASYAGVAAIIGAFLAGMALSESATQRVHDLTSGVSELMVPFFLAGIGLHFDVQSFFTPALLEMSGLILIAAVISKLIGCGLGAASLGRADMLRIGVGMVPRGEVGMVVAQIGLGMGVIPKGVYGVVVFMSVATTLIAPPMIAWSYREKTE